MMLQINSVRNRLFPRERTRSRSWSDLSDLVEEEMDSGFCPYLTGMVICVLVYTLLVYCLNYH